MNTTAERVIRRVVGSLIICLGIYKLITADLQFDARDTYLRTTYLRSSRHVVGNEIVAGRDAVLNERLEGLVCVVFGVFLVWTGRAKKAERLGIVQPPSLPSVQEFDHAPKGVISSPPKTGFAVRIIDFKISREAYLIAALVVSGALYNRSSLGDYSGIVIFGVWITFLIITAFRLHEAGSSRRWALAALVPPFLFFVPVFALIMPKDYSRTKKLDSAGFLLGIILLPLASIAAINFFQGILPK